MGNLIDDLTNGTTTVKALHAFDQLDPIDLDFMLGRWTGAEIPTGHPLDRLLEASNWYGKEFVDADNVHPLVLSKRNGQTYKTTPMMLMMTLGMNVPIFKNLAMKPINGLVTRLVATHKSKARMRMLDFRGKTSATMIYDRLPIHDHFRKIDEHTVMGLMDFKGVENPYFFILQREAE
ncbi:MAG: hypothetical protein ACI9EW_004185 [Cellvibrionaceae bacterium]|jgi:hypothetical protein